MGESRECRQLRVAATPAHLFGSCFVCAVLVDSPAREAVRRGSRDVAAPLGGDLHGYKKHGVSEHRICRWKVKYGGMTVSEAQRLRQLTDENRRLKTFVADLTLDDQALKAVLEKKW